MDCPHPDLFLLVLAPEPRLLRIESHREQPPLPRSETQFKLATIDPFRILHDLESISEIGKLSTSGCFYPGHAPPYGAYVWSIEHITSRHLQRLVLKEDLQYLVSQFLRFLDNKREEGEWMQYSIDNGPLKRKWTGESLASVYESKAHFDKLYDYLSQCEPYVNASRAKKNARNHDPLALVANSYANPSYSHASPSYSRSLQPYYVTHPPFVHDYKDDYQWDIQGQLGIKQLMQETVLLKRLESEKNFLRIPRTTSTLGKANVWCYNCNGKGHYARDYPKPRVRDAKYFRVQMLLATKHEAEVNLDTEENDFMLMNAYGNDQVEDLNASMIMMARIQRTNNKSDAELTYDAEVISKEFETIKHTSVDDQIDSDIIFNDPYVEDNSIQAEHDQDAHDQSFAGLKSLFIMYK
ncbi:reverse transcriptase domain-containing protein [Tanacetum coccineum]